MALTMEEEALFTHIVREITDNKNCLNAWELGFFEDQVKRHDEWGPKMTLTPRQWNVLNKMHEKATGL